MQILFYLDYINNSVNILERFFIKIGDRKMIHVVIPNYVEQGFRWMKETIYLMHAHHKHPLPMTALIFIYMETLGKPLAKKNSNTTKKLVSFVETYMPLLWKELEDFEDREIILANFRNGLAHQIFMKGNCGIHEDISGELSYVSKKFSNCSCSINVDHLVPEFIIGISKYYNHLTKDEKFLKKFEKELPN